MKKTLAAALLALCSAPAFAGGGLDAFIANLNVKAKADLPGFSTTVSAQFGIPLPDVRLVLGGVPHPADAFMIFQISQMSGRPPEHVMNIYKTHGSKGWGAMAQELGIKPGSANFHALKNGNLRYGNSSGHDHDHDHDGEGHGKDHGKGKDKDKGNGRGKDKHDR